MAKASAGHSPRRRVTVRRFLIGPSRSGSTLVGWATADMDGHTVLFVIFVEHGEELEPRAQLREVVAQRGQLQVVGALEDLPPTGARFTAVPPAVRGLATFAVRAFASVPSD